MSTVEKSIRLYAWKTNYQTFQVVQGESDSRTFNIQLFSTTIPVNLTACEVMFFAIKPDSTKVYVECEVVDAENGLARVTLTEQMCVVDGTVDCWVQVIGDGGADLRFEGMNIEVSPCPMTASIMSTDDMRAFLQMGAKLAAVETEVINARAGKESLSAGLDANKTEVSAKVASLQQDLNTQKSRIDTMASLPEGSTRGDAELADLRIPAEGFTVPEGANAGTAVRAQFSALKEDLAKKIGNKTITTWTGKRVYSDPPGYYGGQGSYPSEILDISHYVKIKVKSKSQFVWYRWLNSEGNYEYSVLNKSMHVHKDGFYYYTIYTDEILNLGISKIELGVSGVNFDINGQEITLYVNEEIDYLNETNLVKISKQLYDPYLFENTGYSSSSHDLHSLLGSNRNVYDYIDTSEHKKLYFKVTSSTQSGITFGEIPAVIAYDSAYNMIGISNDGNNYMSENVEVIRKQIVYLTEYKNGEHHYIGRNYDDGCKPTAIGYFEINLSDNVKYIRLAKQLGGELSIYLQSPAFIGFEPIQDLYMTFDEYRYNASTMFEHLVSTSNIITNDNTEKPSVVCFGDSLTAWGGGSIAHDGFLKIVYEKIGVVVENRGHAGATWQDGEGQGRSGVQRINELISSRQKFDMYIFILGTNGKVLVDTGSTSEQHSLDMCGGIRYCLEQLKIYDPTKPILVCLPPQRQEDNNGQQKANEIIKAISNHYSVPTLDLYHDSGIVPNTTINNIGCLNDGLHLGDNGKILIGNLLSSAIKYYLCI